MARVFISYRRADSATFSGRIYDRLIAKYGRRNVFKDVDDIPAGVNFGKYIQDSLRQCAVTLIIIGPHWLDQEAADGGRRLDDAKDWVRLEVETAFALGLTVIPTLVDGARMPKATELPDSLQELTQINSVSVRNDPDFVRDMDRLIAAIDRAFASKPSGGFLGRRSTPSQAKTPPPAQPTTTTPSPTPLPVATPAPLGSVASPPVAVGVAEKTQPAKGQGKGRSGLAGNRPLIAGLAALVLVLAFGGLFAAQAVGAIQARNAATTKTASANATATQGVVNATASASATFAAQTAVVAATQTVAAAFPYSAAAPGPGCDHGWASGAWIGNATGTITCSTDHTTLATESSCGQNCVNGASFGFDLSAIPRPSQYTVSVQAMNLSTNATVFFWLEGTINSSHVTYEFQLNQQGYYSAYRCPCGPEGPVQIASGSDNGVVSHTLAFLINGATVTAVLDGGSKGSKTEAPAPVLTMASLLVFSSNNTSVAQADFANFRVQ